MKRVEHLQLEFIGEIVKELEMAKKEVLAFAEKIAEIRGIEVRVR